MPGRIFLRGNQGAAEASAGGAGVAEVDPGRELRGVRVSAQRRLIGGDDLLGVAFRRGEQGRGELERRDPPAQRGGSSSTMRLDPVFVQRWR